MFSAHSHRNARRNAWTVAVLLTQQVATHIALRAAAAPKHPPQLRRHRRLSSSPKPICRSATVQTPDDLNTSTPRMPSRLRCVPWCCSRLMPNLVSAFIAETSCWRMSSSATGSSSRAVRRGVGELEGEALLWRRRARHCRRHHHSKARGEPRWRPASLANGT